MTRIKGLGDLLIILSLIFFLIFPLTVQALLDYGKQSLLGVDFSGSDLRGATFYLADLQDANLSDCDLEGATLYGSKLKETNFKNSNLREVTLDSAVLEGTDLTNSNLENAFAYSTKFKDVIIDGADFTNVYLEKNIVKELCRKAKGINSITNRSTRSTLMCED
tara:strand:+ start:6170 stop:6661 length:492 start_codon:yes stop_codon:yes gene_type:complete